MTDALRHGCKVGSRKRGGRPDVVSLFYVMSRMGNVLGKITVVGNEKKALAIRVKSPHRVESTAVAWKKREDRRSPMRIANGTKNTGRLVQCKIDFLLRLYLRAANEDD